MRFTLAFLLAGALTCSAQMRDNRDPKMTCDSDHEGSGSRHCDIRETSFSGPGAMTVDAGTNGGITVRGWLRSDVLVRSKVQSWAESDSEATLIAGQVHVNATSGQVNASGPNPLDKSGWAVSYEIFVPQSTGLDLKAHNGGISISDVRGRLEFTTVNGGVSLKRIAGDVRGATTNGGLQIELTGKTWEGSELDATTTNGGISVAVPEGFSAHVQAQTVNGGMQSEFPVVLRGKLNPRELDLNLGGGGPLIHVSTTNGGVAVKQI